MAGVEIVGRGRGRGDIPVGEGAGDVVAAPPIRVSLPVAAALQIEFMPWTAIASSM